MADVETTRRRRIKCDEQKPNCYRCVKAKRACEGYSPARQGQELLACDPITIYSIPFQMPGSQADRQLLHYYCCQVAGSLCSYMDSTLWTTLVLQRCHHQPVIRHALVTLSSLHQDHLRGDFQRGSSSNAKSIELIAKCHRQLRAYLCSPTASPEVALICSIIFYAFESLMGDARQAIWHLDQGLKLWVQCQSDDSGLAPCFDELSGHLDAHFSRLDTQASTFNDYRVPVLMLISPAEKDGIVPVTPEAFLSSVHAEHILTKLQNWTMHVLMKHAQCRSHLSHELPAYLLHEILILDAEFERFGATVNQFSGHETLASTNQTILLRIQAEIYHSVLLERTAIFVSPSASTVSQRLHDALCDMSALLSMSSNPDSESKRSFTLSTQLISIIFFACLKTPDRQTVQMGLSLLHHPMLPNRDGLWDVNVVESVIQAIMERETAPAVGESALPITLEARGSDILEVAGGLDAIYAKMQGSSMSN